MMRPTPEYLKLIEKLENRNIPLVDINCNQIKRGCLGAEYSRCVGCGAWIKKYFPKIYWNPFVKNETWRYEIEHG